MMRLAVLIGTAKQMPCAPPMIAVLMPITAPFASTSAPPELPGLSAASVCTTSSIKPPRLAAHRAPQRGDHANGHGRLQTKRIADRDRKFADPQRVGIAQRRGA